VSTGTSPFVRITTTPGALPTSLVPGPSPGTETVTTGTTPFVRVTVQELTSYVPGPTPGTTTVSTGSVPIVFITTTPGPLSTLYVPGPSPGTETVPGTGTDSSSVVRVTTPISTSLVPGPSPGTTTISSGSTTFVQVTVQELTSFVPGPTPGTTTVSTGSVPIVFITTTPGPLSTLYVPGPSPGTETVPGTGTDSSSVVRVTTPISTSLVPGPSPGTTTISSGSTTFVQVTVQELTSFVPGPTPGTTTVSTGSVPVVYITTPISTIFVPGPSPGTTTSTPTGTASGPPVVVITTPISTIYVPGPTPGTTTSTPTGTQSGPPEVVITTPYSTSFVVGETPGTTTSTPTGSGPPVVYITTPLSVSFVPGPTPGTTTSTPTGSGPPVVYITTPLSTIFVPGPSPGTTTSTPTGTQSGPPVVVITTPLSTIFVPGPSPGTTTSTPTGTASGPPVIVITTPLSTSFTLGPSPGTTTSTPTGTESGPPVVVVTTVLPTTTVFGPTPGTSTQLPSGTVPGIVYVSETPGACPAKCPTASGQGLTVKVFPNEFDVGFGAPGVAIPTFEGVTPIGQTLSDHIGFPYFTTGVNYYDSSKKRQVHGITVDANNFSVEYTGFFEAPRSGVYKLCITADDVGRLFSSGNCSNTATDLAPTNRDPRSTSCTTTASLVAGFLYPIREVYGQISEASNLSLYIQAPGGGSSDVQTGYFYPAGSPCAIDAPQSSSAVDLATSTTYGPVPGTTTISPTGTATSPFVRITQTPAACPRICPSGSGTGLTVKVYSNQFQTGYGYSGNYQNVDFSDRTLLGQGTTNTLTMDYVYLGFDYYGTARRSVFNVPNINANNFTFELSGYFEPPDTGDYEICQYSDDITQIYIGNGINCGAIAPAQLAFSTSSYLSGNCSTIRLLSGYLYPYRETYGQIIGVSYSNVTFKLLPGGSNVTNFPGYLYPAGSGCAQAIETNTVYGPTPGTTSVAPSGTSAGQVTVTETPAACKLNCASGSGTGLLLKAFPNDFQYGFGNYSSTPNTPTFFGVTPTGQTTSENVSFPFYQPPNFERYDANATRLVNNLTVNANNFSLEYTGYFEPPVSGVYEICIAADDRTNVFINNAIGCGPVPYNQIALQTASSADGNCANINLVAGYLYPFRNVYGQIQGDSNLRVTFQPPGGVATISFPGYFYPPDSPCAGTSSTAP